MNTTPLPGLTLFALSFTLLAGDPPATQSGTAPLEAFARLKSLAGEWKGGIGKPEGPPSTVIYRVTAAGHTVMETLFPGTDHEMISMYHLDGDNLVLTHYCAVGNQPRMKLNPGKSTQTELVFDFDEQSHLDATKDVHIHCGRIRQPASDRLEADWILHAGGKPAGTNSFYLSRQPE